MSVIKGCENYIIFEDGVIINNNTGKEMKPHMEKTGYYRICLSKNDKQKNFMLHRLIALAFIPNPDNKETVDHINRIKNDNRIENLRWASKSEQERNKNCYTSTGLKFISKQVCKIYKQGFTYQFQINRPEIKYKQASIDLKKIIKIRNDFCKENDIEINDA